MSSLSRRSAHKGIFVSEGVIRALLRHEKNPSSLIRIWDRGSTITPRFVGKTVHVYNGKSFVPFVVTEAHVLHKFGEFSPTRARVKHSGSKKNKGGKK